MVTQAGIYLASQIFCLPCELLLNFGLFQFLFFIFFERRQESAVRILMTVAFFSFACLIPGAHPNHQLVRNLNDISDVCSVLTFLLQIIILTNDVNKKFKIATISRLSSVAQVLVVLSCIVLLINVVDSACPELGLATTELVDVIIQHISLAFVVGFRFYFLAMARGLAKVWRSQKLEVVFYLLLATHAIPFHVLTQATGLDWHHVQGLWMRVTITLCLSSTIRAKLSNRSSKRSQSVFHSKGRNILLAGPSSPSANLLKTSPRKRITPTVSTPSYQGDERVDCNTKT
ncbi:hypothetical protein PF005_g11910 [Phytophthora fragariae]|uniref:Intimal thickness related receptor IRP domain-containing protein n=1 Tax=Phytophthora fragariae TaxID=53985 RepID=A0A6A3EQ00_9STRA|nr:hypothetical protein PF003_g28708 [Phytophthora fragariae]KAE8934527.1 hypothetical protein PF009_g15496 [Phytophthora fragariae]KAE8997170.1 hypothetical protein PF011_g15594 [Phytophthora fragariae]KAE9078873.1 hypothetical protein PF010_g22970 [Phytophthora fragariae]KAE9100417.1 hypothetical protein PF006_g22902 [Phytophthora fragariae]